MSVALVRVGPLMVIPSMMEELGYGTEEIFADLPLTPADLADPDNEVSYVALFELVARCASITGREDLGLSLGKHADLSALGIPALMVRFAPNVGTALASLVENLDLHDQGGLPYLNVQKNYSHLGYVIQQPGVAAVDQVYDLAMAIGFRLLRETCGPAFQPYCVSLSRPTPRDASAYKALFGARVVFNASKSEIVFQTHWLERPNPHGNPHLFEHFGRYATQMHANRPQSADETMRRFVRRSVLSGSVRYKEVAEFFGLRERTLNRRLAARGTSFRIELNKIRYELAKQLLSATGMSITDIAIELNYSDASAFVRAFRNWSGTSPGHWRRQHQRRSSLAPILTASTPSGRDA